LGRKRRADNLPEDLVVLVDDNDVPSGYGVKEKCHTVSNGVPGYHHRGLTVLVQNGRGEVLLQHRKHRIFDKVWDLAGSTHPYFHEGRQESYEDAAKRCLSTEYSGLEDAPVVNSSVFVNYAAVDPLDNRYCENEFCRLIVASHQGAVRHNPENAYGLAWVTLPTLMSDLARSPSKYAPWVVDLLEDVKRKRPVELSSLT
jgi:isopentenyl-diphosphate delta-isomerase